MSYFNHKLFPVLVNNLPPTQSNILQKLIADDDVHGLVGLSVDRTKPVEFSDVLFSELFRKVSDAPLGVDTAGVAVAGFVDNELWNSRSNEKIATLKTFIINNPGHELSVFIRRVREQIAIIIGNSPLDIAPNMTFGATGTLKRGNTLFTRFNKPTVTLECLEYLRAAGEIRSDYNVSKYPRSSNAPSPFGSSSDDFEIVTSCVLSTVPKTAKIDRAITKDAVVNLAYQGGAGREIRRLLKSFGVDITTRQQLHNSLAQLGSLTGHLATADLSSASDLICKNLVELLLPEAWYDYLNAMRCQSIDINGTETELQMFSSAGNGFTFELETLIFLSLTIICVKKLPQKTVPNDVSVYGDDIILPSKSFDKLAVVFKTLRFKLNERKSFATGSFRESCGGDFYLGINVRGYNLESLPETTVEWISVINAIRRICYYNYGSTWRDRWCYDLWQGLISLLPKDEQLYGPRHYGDTCINTEQHELYSISTRKWTGEYIKVHSDFGGDFTSVGREISGNSLKADLVFRLVTHESVRGHGATGVVNLIRGGENKNSYPYTISTSSFGVKTQQKFIPFTLSGQAPEDLDELIYDHLLNKSNADFLRYPRRAGIQTRSKYAYDALLKYRNLNRLCTLLAQITHVKVERERNDLSEFETFSLS